MLRGDRFEPLNVLYILGIQSIGGPDSPNTCFFQIP